MKAAPEPTELASLIDEAGALEDELAPTRIKARRLEAVRALIRAKCGLKPHESAKLEGIRYSCLIGACEFQRRIKDMAAVFRLVGRKLFLQKCKFTLKDLDEAVAPDERGKLIVTEQTGPRDVKTYRKAA